MKHRTDVPLELIDYRSPFTYPAIHARCLHVLTKIQCLPYRLSTPHDAVPFTKTALHFSVPTLAIKRHARTRTGIHSQLTATRKISHTHPLSTLNKIPTETTYKTSGLE